MKKIFAVLILASAFVLFSCKKNTGTNQSQSNNTNPASAIFDTESNWLVTNFMKNGSDQTLSYSTSKILFSPDGDFAVSNDALPVDGKWVFGTLSENTLHLDFNNPEAITYDPWKDIQDLWKINRYTATTLDLQSIDNNKMMSLQKISR